MNIQRILERFAQLANMDSDEAVTFRFLCIAAADSVSQSILPDALEREEYRERLEYAAAVWAYYKYVLWESSMENDVSIGEVTVRNSAKDKVEFARKLLAEALENLAEVSCGGGFVFEGI